ncbi:MAG TPA: hypothetical protein VGJ76_03070 [Pseudolabrys sp.]|jgi:hypothetical protein
MFRKLARTLGATIAIGAAALIPTSASAHMHGHHGHVIGAAVSLSASLRRQPSLRRSATS